MSEKPLSMRSTSEQAHTVATEIGRILSDVRLSPGLNINNNRAVHKIRHHQGILFVHYPEGEHNVQDPRIMNLAVAGIDNPDGSRDGYTVENHPERGVELTKHFYPGNRPTPQIIDIGDDPVIMLAKSQSNLLDAMKDVEQERQLRAEGEHFVSFEEAAELIGRLSLIPNAPNHRF